MTLGGKQMDYCEFCGQLMPKDSNGDCGDYNCRELQRCARMDAPAYRDAMARAMNLARSILDSELGGDRHDHN